MNWQAISDFFTYLYVPGPETAFDGILQLPPGHILTLQLCGTIPFRSNAIGMFSSRVEIRAILLRATEIAIFARTLAASVKRQLVSDVPIGVFLSGGIDSTIVTGLAKREKQTSKPIR